MIAAREELAEIKSLMAMNMTDDNPYRAPSPEPSRPRPPFRLSRIEAFVVLAIVIELALLLIEQWRVVD